MRTLEERFEEKYIPEPNSGCWLWVGAMNGWGYGVFWLKGKLLSAHRFSWDIHNGPIPQGVYVCHKCDTKCCVNPTHLFLGTQKDNMEDCIRKGRFHAQGETHGHAKLTNANIETIRLLLLFGHTQRPIAEKFGISQTHVSEINTRKKWKHI